MDIKNYIEERLNHQIEWYERKARSARQRSLFIQAYQMTLILAIPILLLGSEMLPVSEYLSKILASLCAIFAAALTAMDKSTRLDTSWEQYRFIAEKLKKEHLSFQMSLGDYEDMDDDKKAKLFVERSESLMSSELSRWFAGQHSERQKK